jgi:transcriptional regulator with PAS, ATPase and Fis domain
MSFSGMKSVIEICEEISDWTPQNKLFIELMACKGGCIKGPATKTSAGLAGKRDRLLKDYDLFKKSGMAFPLKSCEIDLSNSKYKIPYKINCVYSEAEIQEMLNSIGKKAKVDELNCSGCGYDNCRQYAIALLDGKAEREMCISQMRKEAQNRASVLLRKMPYGVVLVDKSLTIIDTNQKFIENGGDEIGMIADTLGRLAGADLRKVISYHKYFSAVLSSGEESSEYDIEENGKRIRLSIITIEPNKTVCGIVQSMDSSELIMDLVSDKVRDVIKHNAESVQRIAYILGESASFTESVLSSVINKEKNKN